MRYTTSEKDVIKMKKGPLYVLLCYIIWGLLPVFWKQLQVVDSLYVLASRIVWSFVFCGAIILIKKEGKKVVKALKNPKDFWTLLAAGIMVTINWGFYIIAIHTNHIIDSSLAYYMNPIFAVLIGFSIFREKLSKQQWLSVIIATIGVGYSVVMYGKIPTFALIIGGSFAIYGAIKKTLKMESEVSLFVETMFIIPFALIYMIWSRSQGSVGIENLQGLSAFYLPLSGAITSIPLLFYAEGIKDTPLKTAGLLMYVNPTLQLLLGVVVYNEVFTRVNAITFVFIGVALFVYIPTMLKKNELEA